LRAGTVLKKCRAAPKQQSSADEGVCIKTW
jgi:hypothetical protein